MKLTAEQLKTVTATYVNKAKQAGAWNSTTDNLLKLIDKIGLMVTLDGDYQDKLPELDGNDLPLGKTIEEWFIDLTLPEDYDPNGAKALEPHYPTVQETAYSYSLGRKVIPTTQPYNNLERACLTTESASNMLVKILENLHNSATLYRYFQKKQLLGNLAEKVIAKVGNTKMVHTLAVPSDTATSEAFIKQIKSDVENASFPNEGNSLGSAVIGASPQLMLYVKKGIMPTVEVDALAGAFNKENLAIPATIKVVDDFGTMTGNEDVYAILVDPRGVKLHRGYHAIRSQENGLGDFMNFFDHSENTAFISKNVFVNIYRSGKKTL